MSQASGSSERWSEEEGAARVATWRQSGKSLTQFCRDHGITTHRLRCWIGRADEAPVLRRKVRASEQFFSVTTGHGDEHQDKSTSFPRPEGSLEVCVGEWARIRVTGEARQDLFVQTLRWIAQAVQS